MILKERQGGCSTLSLHTAQGPDFHVLSQAPHPATRGEGNRFSPWFLICIHVPLDAVGCLLRWVVVALLVCHKQNITGLTGMEMPLLSQ